MKSIVWLLRVHCVCCCKSVQLSRVSGLLYIYIHSFTQPCCLYSFICAESELSWTETEPYAANLSPTAVIQGLSVKHMSVLHMLQLGSSALR